MRRRVSGSGTPSGRSLTALLVAGALASAVAPLTAPPALAYSVSLTGGDDGVVVRWNKKTLGFHLHPACSADLPAASCLEAVRQSFARWTAPCAEVTFQELAPSTNLNLTSIGYGDNGKNEIAWIEGSQWTYGKYTLGVTGPVFWTSGPEAGSIFEADIALNGYLQKWSLSGASYSTDVENVLVHEIGHYFGLQHNLGGYDESDPPTMAPTADSFMASRTPEADDLAGLCFLQPKGSHTCAANADCPLVVDDGPEGEYYVGQMACSGGFCGGVSNEVPAGDAALGEKCTGSYDCKSPLFCQPMSGGAGVCAQECAVASSNCPSGFGCVPYANAPSQGVCLAGANPVGGTQDIGEPCGSSSDCKSQLCVVEDGAQVCRQKCTGAQPCPAGFQCYGLGGVNYGACFEVATPAPGSPTGTPCQTSSECASGLCAGDGFSYACTDKCTSSAQCPGGYACFALSASVGGCFKTEEKGVGDPCDGDYACASDFCASIGGSPYVCTDFCGSAADCPCGMACVGTTSGSVCAPAAKVACVPDGAPCGADAECSSGVCDGGTCATSCSILSPPGACSPGLACGRIDEGEPDGVCTAPGPNALGKPCGQDNACQSLVCHENVCSRPCSPFGASVCGGDELCEPIGGALGGGTLGICGPKPPPQPEPQPEPSPDAASSDDVPGQASDVGPELPSDSDVKGGAETTTVDPGTPPVSGNGGSAGGVGCAGGDGSPAWPMVLLALLLCGLGRRGRAMRPD